jgi:hypothetical protein
MELERGLEIVWLQRGWNFSEQTSALILTLRRFGDAVMRTKDTSPYMFQPVLLIGKRTSLIALVCGNSSGSDRRIENACLIAKYLRLAASVVGKQATEIMPFMPDKRSTLAKKCWLCDCRTSAKGGHIWAWNCWRPFVGGVSSWQRNNMSSEKERRSSRTLKTTIEPPKNETRTPSDSFARSDRQLARIKPQKRRST